MFKKPLFFALLSAVIAGNAMASASLPTVNPNNSVSARELFGAVNVAPLPQNQRQVAQRHTNYHAPQINPTSARMDILAPRRPDANLWARGATAPITPEVQFLDVPLRMPQAHEFTVLESDFRLPPEELFASAPRTTGGAQVRVPQAAAPRNVPAPQMGNPLHTHQIDPAAARQQQAQTTTIRNPHAASPARFAPAPQPAPRAATVVPRATGVMPAPQRLEEPRIEIERLNVYFEESAPEPQAAEQSIFAWAPSPELIAEVSRPREVETPLNRLNPLELREAFQRTFVSENRHLSAFRIDDRFDAASTMTEQLVGFEAIRDLADAGGIRPLEIKIIFRGNDSSLSRDNFQLISEYAGMVVRNPQRAVQISIPERATRSFEGRRLAARRMTIIEQVLRDSGVPENRIIPVLADRADDSFVLRIISTDVLQTLSEQRRNMFGDVVEETTSRRLAW